MAKQWLSASDPYWSQFTRPGEFGDENPYGSTIAGLESPDQWMQVARPLGFNENFYYSDEFYYGYSPEFMQFIQQKKAEGYDFVVDKDTINNRTATFGFKLPDGRVAAEYPVKASGFGEFFKEFLLPAAGIAFGMGGLNSLMGGAAAAPANALAGIAEGMIPGGLTAAGIPATAAELAAVGALTGAAPAVEVMDLAPLQNAVTNVTTPAAAAADAATAMQLSPLTQLQPITQAPNALASIEALAGVPIDPAFAAGMGVDAGMAALTPEVLAQISAGIGAGANIGALAGGGAVTPTAAAPTAATTAGAAAPVAAAGGVAGGGDFLSGMSDVAATEGAGVAGTGILTQGTNIPSAVLGGGTILDQAIDLLKTPAGQAVVGAVGSVASGVMQAEAAKDVAQQQAGAAENALKLQREMFEYQQSLLAPYRKAGEAALGRLTGAMGLGGPAQQQQMLEMDPGYGFRLGEGMKALERMQAARGNMLSGGALKAGQRYAQDYASGEYSNAYNRLANIAGLGQTAGTQLGAAGERFAQGAGQTGMEAANALAAGRIGRASAYTGAIQGGLNAYQNYLNRQREEQLFRDIFGRTAIGG